VGALSRAQGCVPGISPEPGRSQEGGEHDLENPYRDEKVQPASAFPGWQRALRLRGAPSSSSSWKGLPAGRGRASVHPSVRSVAGLA